MIHLTFLVRQLTCAVTRGGIHHRWRHNLRITALAGLVEEEVDEGALQTGTLAYIHGESGTGDFYAQVKVDKVVFLGELPVGQGILDTQLGIHVPVAYGVIPSAFLQVRFHHMVVFSSLALRHLVVRDVRNLAKHLRHLLLSLSHGLIHLLRLLFQLSHLSLHLLSLVFLTFFHQSADLTRQLFLFIQTLVELLLSLAALLIHSQYFVDSLLGIGEMFLLQTTDDAIGFLINKFEC